MYLLIYNYECPYQALDFRTPAEVHFGIDRGVQVLVSTNLNLVDMWFRYEGHLRQPSLRYWILVGVEGSQMPYRRKYGL